MKLLPFAEKGIWLRLYYPALLKSRVYYFGTGEKNERANGIGEKIFAIY